MFTPKYTIEEKKEIVDEWKVSGLCMAEFCRRKDINTSTFDGWLNRFYPESLWKRICFQAFTFGLLFFDLCPFPLRLSQRSASFSESLICVLNVE